MAVRWSLPNPGPAWRTPAIGKLSALVFAGVLTLGAGSTNAADCRQALVLAMDVSSSVDNREDSLQRQGLANALLSPDVEAAIFASSLPVAIAAYEWSGRDKHTLLSDWRLIATRGDLLDLAETIRGSQRSETEFPTAMGYALGYGAGLLARGPDCLFRTLDLAGDGINNEGFGPEEAYAAFPFDEIVVNGLVVAPLDGPDQADVENFYRDRVIRGPGAFLEVARGFADYERAMRRKLLRELRPRAIGLLSAPERRQHPG